jgi:lipoprotein-anchoring transpeptidase ErfK/SrfK
MKKLFLFLSIIIFSFWIFKAPANAQVLTTDKLITVDIGKGMLYAWDQGKIVNQSPAATGMRYTPTVKGMYKIYRKISLQDMKGNYPPYPPYNIKNVPNVMYFHQAYAIHGAWWHNNFGARVSHGCVNIPVEFSKWLYDWAPAGTGVYIF